jgi:hypothetical protein
MMDDPLEAKFLTFFKKSSIEQAVQEAHRYGADFPPHYTMAFISAQGEPGVGPILTDHKSDEDHQRFFDKVIPQVFVDLKNNGFRPICFCTITIAWSVLKLREEVSAEEQLEGIDEAELDKDPSKREVLLISFQEPNKDSVQMYEVFRVGQKIDADGDLIDEVELKELVNYESDDGQLIGASTNVFKHYQP